VFSPGKRAVAPGKSQTYAVEANNAELRHDLAHLARTSRCFSRSIDALRRAVKLFVCAWNRRQLHRRTYPT
jgi:IS1 family transposase